VDDRPPIRDPIVIARLPCGVCRIPKLLIQRHRLTNQLPHHFRVDPIALAQFDRRHLIFSTRLEPRLDLAQTLPAPESEQDSPFLGANQ